MQSKYIMHCKKEIRTYQAIRIKDLSFTSIHCEKFGNNYEALLDIPLQTAW